MKKANVSRWNARGVFMGVPALILPLFVVSAEPTEPKSPHTQTQTVYFRDVSAYFYNQMPFLKTGLRFMDSSASLDVKEGDSTTLTVEPAVSQEGKAPGEGKAIRETKDFAPFVKAIRTERDAYGYALFLSRKGFPWMERIRQNYFQDVPFIGVEFVASPEVLTKAGIQTPRLSATGGTLFRKKIFTIVRTVVPLDQPSLAEEKIYSGVTPLSVPQLAEATETVGEDGSYSFVLRRFTVKSFSIENPLIRVRKGKK